MPVEDLTDIAVHVGGYHLSEGNWSNSDFTPLVLPNVELKEVVDFKLQRKSEKLSAEEYVEQGKFTCEDRYQGYSCLELVTLLNTYVPDVLQPGVRGLAILPYRRLTAFIPTHQAAFQDTGTVQEIQSSIEQVSEAWKKILAERDSRFLIADGLAKNLETWGGINLQSAAKDEPQYAAKDEPRYSDQKSLFEAISHPFGNDSPLPLAMQQEVKIGVLDNFLDTDHCDFGDNVTIFGSGG